MRGRWSAFLGATAIATAAAAALGSCSDGGEEVVVNERIFRLEGSTLTSQGGGCSNMKLPGGGSPQTGGGLGDFSFAEGTEGDAFVVRVYSDAELLASRSYNAVRLRFSQVDEFSVTTHSGAVYVLRYWGGACTPLSAPSP
jgi:hypothetical protein